MERKFCPHTEPEPFDFCAIYNLTNERFSIHNLGQGWLKFWRHNSWFTECDWKKSVSLILKQELILVILLTLHGLLSYPYRYPLRWNLSWNFLFWLNLPIIFYLGLIHLSVSREEIVWANAMAFSCINHNCRVRKAFHIVIQYWVPFMLAILFYLISFLFKNADPDLWTWLRNDKRSHPMYRYIYMHHGF